MASVYVVAWLLRYLPDTTELAMTKGISVAPVGDGVLQGDVQHGANAQLRQFCKGLADVLTLRIALRTPRSSRGCSHRASHCQATPGDDELLT